MNEAYLRLIEIKQVQWQNRVHFFAMAARIMRRILVDAARAKAYQKRGGGAQRVSFDEALVVEAPGQDFVALDDALNALESVDARKCQVVEMRFFGGLSVEETAAALDVSVGTVLRDWRLAKAWLARELSASDVVSADRWSSIERLYHEALTRPAGDRTAFLHEACGGDDALRHEVESLLAHDGDASFLSTPAATLGAWPCPPRRAGAGFVRHLGTTRRRRDGGGVPRA